MGSCSNSISGYLAAKVSLVGTVNPITGGDHRDPYEGDYIVTPETFEDLILPTANKYMKEDLTILKTPYYKTTNESGGYTAYIGKEG